MKDEKEMATRRALGGVPWAAGRAHAKAGLALREAHVQLLVTKCSPQTSSGPHPTPSRGQPRQRGPVLTPSVAEGGRQQNK